MTHRKKNWLRGAAIFSIALSLFSISPFVALADPPGVAARGDQGVQPNVGGPNCESNEGGCVPPNAPTATSYAPPGVAPALGTCATGLISWALEQLGVSAAKAGVAAALGSAGIVGNPVAVPVNDLGTHLGVNGTALGSAVTAISNNVIEGGVLTKLFSDDFLGCMARAIARALIQQTVVATVNWIRSGFNGSPFFVTDPTTFFQSVANVAVGNYLQSSDLAFLCTPFSLQVKTAIAQAYAGYYYPQCTLSSATNNIAGFMNNFQYGGWPAFISMTSNPVNQPFGAYTQAQNGLYAAVANSQYYYQNQLTLSGGFLNFQQQVNCQNYAPGTLPPSKPNQTQDYDSASNVTKVCDVITATPGKVLESQLSKAIGMNLDELNLAKSFDEIISALITQLFQNIFSNGLLNLGGTSNTTPYGSSYTNGIPNDSTASLISQAEVQIPGYLSSEQALQGIYSQDIADVKSSLAAANNALSCWQGLGAAGSSGVAKSTQDVNALNQNLSTYKSQSQSAAQSVTTLQNYQSQLQSASDLDTLQNIVVAFTNAISAGTFPDQSAIDGANEDRLGLTNTLATINQNESSSLSACQAAGGTAAAPGGSAPSSAHRFPAPTCSLTASPTAVYDGSPVALTWASTNADTGSIDPGVGAVSPASSGSITVYPATSATGGTTYTGTFTGKGGSATCSAGITVYPQAQNGGGGG